VHRLAETENLGHRGSVERERAIVFSY
jgi:hypothetical protein